MIMNKDAGEFLRELAPASVDLVLTSPPYWCQRTYGDDVRELGTEPVVLDYINRLAGILHEAWSCVRPTGWVAVNIADTYANQPGQYRHSDKSGVSASNRAKAGSAPMRSLAGLPLKTQAGVPERLKIAMIDRGWRCRNTIIWHKTSPLPTTATDRWNLSYEVVHVFARSAKSYFSRTEQGGFAEYGTHDVWTVNPARRQAGNHPALMPEQLVARLVDQLCPVGGLVVDPFAGSGTVLRVARDRLRDACGADIYCWEKRSAGNLQTV
jgi:site-specific DNA-methyltransferase (adenine-specific)